jgi:hypothetical protein
MWAAATGSLPFPIWFPTVAAAAGHARRPWSAPQLLLLLLLLSSTTILLLLGRSPSDGIITLAP